MRRICISKKQYKQFLENELFQNFDGQADDENLKSWLEESRLYFDTEIIALNYFLSMLLEQYLKIGEKKCIDILEFIYKIKEKMYLTVEEFDYKFIDNMMTRNLPNYTNSLEEDLIEIRNSYYG